VKKVLISRYGAFGDIIHCSHLPRLLKENGYDYVAFETNYKGTQLLSHNPFIDKMMFFEPSDCMAVYSSITLMKRHWDDISRDYDKFINLFWSLEHSIIAMEDDPEYYMHSDARKFMREINFYDQTSKWAGFPELMGKYKGEIWYTTEEKRIVEKWMKKFEEKFILMINLTGTTIHKVLLDYQEYIDYVLDNYPDAHVITTGDETCKDLVKETDRITNIAGKFPFRQAAHIIRYVNSVLTMESGIGVVGNMWGTPTVQLMTSSSIKNHPNGCSGDFSLQSPARCSPCSKGPYKFIGCPSENGYPLCVYFDKRKVKDRLDETYRAYQEDRFSIEDRFSGENVNAVSFVPEPTSDIC